MKYKYAMETACVLLCLGGVFLSGTEGLGLGLIASAIIILLREIFIWDL